MKFAVKNWSTFQHYKSRRPPWIKLHRTLLDDQDWHALPDASKALAVSLWLLASESEDGFFDGDSKALAFRLRTDSKLIAEAIKPLKDRGFLLDASKVLAGCEQVAPKSCSETETETETETEFLANLEDSIKTLEGGVDPETGEITEGGHDDF